MNISKYCCMFVLIIRCKIKKKKTDVKTKKLIISYSKRGTCEEIDITLIEHYNYLPFKAPIELL